MLLCIKSAILVGHKAAQFDNLLKSCALQAKTKEVFMRRIRSLFEENIILMRSIPSYLTALFFLSVVMMNLLANKTIYSSFYLALDGGILISWLSFLAMDILTKHFGARAANFLNFDAVIINSFCSLIFFIAAVIPTEDDYSGFNQIFGGTWFIFLSSTIAFLIGGFINNLLNALTGKLFKKNPDGKLAFFTRSYISTFVGQFLDNLIFSLFCFMLFAPIFWDGFSWTFLQCVTCALTGALCELVFEAIFSPIGYLITKKWAKENVGSYYLEYRRETENGSCNG